MGNAERRRRRSQSKNKQAENASAPLKATLLPTDAAPSLSQAGRKLQPLVTGRAIYSIRGCLIVTCISLMTRFRQTPLLFKKQSQKYDCSLLNETVLFSLHATIVTTGKALLFLLF